MGKDSNKHLVGQTILQQILDLVPREVFDKLVLEHETDKYYKTFDAWTHFVTMQFAILSRCVSTLEIRLQDADLAGQTQPSEPGFIAGQEHDWRLTTWA